MHSMFFNTLWFLTYINRMGDNDDSNDEDGLYEIDDDPYERMESKDLP